MSAGQVQLRRDEILPERVLPEARELIEEGRQLARRVTLADCAFLRAHQVESEAAFKRECAAAGSVMLHAQIGYRKFAKSLRAYAEIHRRVVDAGGRLDRYGICIDQSMGYPAAQRRQMPRGTGLLLEAPEQFAALTDAAPVAPHFGDFVLGTPAALENTAAALGAGATAIGNLGQYFTFRLPGWDDDVTTTAETVKAIALITAQPQTILVHSNLDDGFAALFCDLACSLGAVLIEQHAAGTLLGASVSHCYGHTFAEPLKRLAFQRALAAVETVPGTMVYGNTTAYRVSHAANYASLAAYLLVDIAAQRTRASGHAVNPVPVTESERIPEIDEIVDAHLFAHRLIELSDGLLEVVDSDAADGLATEIVVGARQFCARVLSGLDEAGIDTHNPLELLLALKRIGARRLEALYGPGEADPGSPRGRRPRVPSTTLSEIEAAGRRSAGSLPAVDAARIRAAGLAACVAATDVHEYGKLLVESVLGTLGVRVIDGGVSVDPQALARRASESGADFIALSTYNGVALAFVEDTRRALAELGCDTPLLIGGRLNRIPDASNSSLPVDVGRELAEAGAVVCRKIDDLLGELLRMAEDART